MLSSWPLVVALGFGFGAFVVLGAEIDHTVTDGGVRYEQGGQTIDKSGMIQVSPGVWIRSEDTATDPVMDRSTGLQMPQVLSSEGLEHAHRWYTWVFVMFTAPSCAYCAKVSPDFKAVAEQWDGHEQGLRVVKVDCTTTGTTVCSWLKIHQFPKFKLFHQDVDMKMPIDFPPRMEHTSPLLAGFLEHHTKLTSPDPSWLRGPDYVLRPPQIGWRALSKHRRLKKMRSIHCAICATMMRDLWKGTRYLADQQGILGTGVPSKWRMDERRNVVGETSDDIIENAFEKLCETPARRLQRMSLDLESRALALQIPGRGEADVPWVNAAGQMVSFRSFDYRFACERLIGEFDDDVIRALKSSAKSLPQFIGRVCSAETCGACGDGELRRLTDFLTMKQSRQEKIDSMKQARKEATDTTHTNNNEKYAQQATGGVPSSGPHADSGEMTRSLGTQDAYVDSGVDLSDEELEEFDEFDSDDDAHQHEEL